MTNARSWLTALLLLQLALAGGLLLSRQQSGDDGSPQPLLPVAANAIDRVVVSDAASQATVIRQDGAWVLPGTQLPANASKVADILQRLEQTATEWPVTTTQGSHERFEVGEEAFQRRVQLFSGDEKVAEFYLGTSPGFRKVHLRRATENAVYAVTLNTFDLPAGDDAWLDHSLLAVTDPTRIVGPDYTLAESADGVWSLAGEEAAPETGNASLDDEQARQLVSAFANLRVQSVADRIPDAETGQGMSVEVETADGSYRYHFHQDEAGYYVRREDRAAVFNLSQYDYDRITGVGLAELVHQTGETETAGAGTESES